ncbi:MAG: MFS transporter [Bacteroides sp.]|nr:MFS transporter [Bacteroides sp.]
MKESSSRRIHYGFVILACCCLMMGVDVGLVMSCASIFYGPVSGALGVSVGEFGVYMSLSFITSSLMLSVAGNMLERYSARRVITVASAVCGVALGAMGLYDALWEFYVSGAVMGATLAFLLYMGFPTLINRWFRTRVGLLIGICSASSGIGGIIFNPIGGWVITEWGWRWGYILFGLIILLLVTPALGLLLRDHPADRGLRPFGEEAGAAEKGREDEASVRKEDNLGEEYAVEKSAVVQGDSVSYSAAVRMPVFYALVAFAFLVMAISTLNLFIPKYATVEGFSLEQSAIAASSIMAGVTVGKLLLGYINDRSCRLGTLVTGICGITGLALLLADSDSLAVLLTGSFLFGWEYAGVTVQTAMLVRTVFGSGDYARIFSVISMALAAGGAVASAGWGFMSDALGFPSIFLAGILLLALAVALGLISLRSRRRAAGL